MTTSSARDAERKCTAKMSILIHASPVVAHQNERLVPDARQKRRGRNVMEQILTELANLSWFGVAIATVGIVLQIVLLAIVLWRMRH